MLLLLMGLVVVEGHSGWVWAIGVVGGRVISGSSDITLRCGTLRMESASKSLS